MSSSGPIGTATWSNAYRRGGIIAIQRPFNWAEELGYTPRHPIKKIPKPQSQRREIKTVSTGRVGED